MTPVSCSRALWSCLSPSMASWSLKTQTYSLPKKLLSIDCYAIKELRKFYLRREGGVLRRFERRKVKNTCGLLSLDQSSGTFQADDQATSDLGIEGTTVTSLFHGGETLQEDFLDPGDDFVGRRVGGLVEIDDTVLDVFFNGSLKRGVTLGDGSVVVGLGVKTVVILDGVRK